MDFLPPDHEPLAVRSVFVATTRTEDPRLGFPGAGRDTALHFGRYDVAIPPAHTLGQLRRTRGSLPLDPEREFSLTGMETLDAPGFRAQVAGALARQTRRQREAVIFVHGFNTDFAGGIYRVAQLGHDLMLPEATLHYSWPSAGHPLAYAHDRDSALFARDGLEAMLNETLAAGAERVILVGHSMGAHLLMETLRQIALRGDGRLMGRIGGVILISPDIDVELFRSQALSIGTLPRPFMIVTSRRDRILRLSARLTGQHSRLGNLDDPAQIEGLGVTLFDVSAFSTGTGHFDVANSPALIQLLDQVGAVDAALGNDDSGRLPLLPATILTLQNTTQIILEPLGAPRRWMQAQAEPAAARD